MDAARQATENGLDNGVPDGEERIIYVQQYYVQTMYSRPPDAGQSLAGDHHSCHECSCVRGALYPAWERQ